MLFRRCLVYDELGVLLPFRSCLVYGELGVLCYAGVVWYMMSLVF